MIGIRDIFETTIGRSPAVGFTRRAREELVDLRLDFADYEYLEGRIAGFDARGAALFEAPIRDFVAAIPCFTPDTLLATESGACRAGDLVPGARLLTRDNGVQVLRWIGERTFSARDLALNPLLRPVRVRAGALGPDQPLRDLIVSPSHHLLSVFQDGQGEAMVMARDLVGMDGIEEITPQEGVRYLQLLFDRHELILGEGVWAESFRPTPESIAALEQIARADLLAKRADLLESADYRPVRPSLSGLPRSLHDAHG